LSREYTIMFNYFSWKIKKYWEKTFLINEKFWIWLEICYQGNKKEWIFFIYPYFEQNLHTYINFCFDTIEQKKLFEKLIKIPGIGPKTAYNISTIPWDNLKQALENNDIKFFTKLPWIGPKTSKRIIVELKENFDKIDLEKINIDEKLFNQITKTLSNLWYNKKDIVELLQKCPIKLEEKNLQQIIKRLLDNLS